MKEIKLLEQLTGKTVVLEANVPSRDVGAGDVIKTKFGTFVIIAGPKLGRSWVNFSVTDFNKIESYLSGKEEISIQSYKVKAGIGVDKINSIPKNKTLALQKLYYAKDDEINQHNNKITQDKFDRNAPLVNWDSTKHQYGVTMVDGSVAFAGDQVQVKFSNGIFGGTIKGIAGRQDGAVMVLFRGKEKARAIAPTMILKKV